VDILKIMYGDAEKPTPRDQMQLFTTVVLGAPARAKVIVEGTTPAADGSNFVALMLARAWLGMLPGDESRRLRDGISGSPTSMFGAVIRMQRARTGDAGALRTLLDAYGPDSIRFQRGETASMQVIDQQWGGSYTEARGVATAAYSATSGSPWLASATIVPLFKAQPPAAWRDWWACRRGLMEYDPASGKFGFTELP
jgi:hypothetical protein